MFEILKREVMGDGSMAMNEISSPLIAKKAKPGQFVILRANEKGERIPLTLAATNPERGTITVIYQVVGKSTAMFKDMEVGETFQDITGPLGKPTDIHNVGNVVCVGGGTGIAVMYPLVKAMKEAGNYVITIIGARTKDLLILEDWLKEYSDEFHICTDDGTCGHHGFVTDVLKQQLDSKEIAETIAVGPVPMMKFVSKMTADYNVKTLVSLNAIMVDGTGMCGCCRVTVGNETRFACVDGPEFDAQLVDFQELSSRLQAYTDMEKQAFEKYKCECGS